jgi:cytochrome-b5 reductase
VKIVFSSKPLPPVLPIGVSKSVLQVFGGKENLIKGVAFISAAILVQQYWSRIPETVAIQSPNNAVSPFWKGVTITAAIATAIVSAVVWNFYKTLVMRKGFRRYPPVIGRPTRALRGPKPREVIADVLTPHTYQHFPLLEKRQLSHNTYRLIFGLPKPTDTLGLPLGQHVNIRADIDGATVTRSYTPTSSNKDLGTMSLTVKVYHGSKMGNYLRNLPLQTPVSIRGPVGGFKKYHRFLYTHLAMVAGGTGITPMYQFIQEICNDPLDDTKITLLYGNRTEDDILMRDSMDALAKQYPGSFKVYYFLETPPQQWRGEKGRITKEAMLNLLPPVKTGLKYLVCGPDAMVGAVTDNLKAIGCEMSQAGSKSSGQVFVF